MDIISTDIIAMDDFIEDDIMDPDFDWDSFLKQNNMEAIPEACLPHVHRKANIMLSAGMKIELPYMEENKTKYWVVTVVMSLGPVVRLRYLGDTNPNRDKWTMVNGVKAHPLGWCARCNLSLVPPSYLSHVDREALLEELNKEEAMTVQEYATFEYEQFVPGMKLEIEDELCPYRVWVGNIVENYGGRLQLRYDTPNSEEPTFWLFHTSRRIHPYGWTKSQGAPWTIEKPSHIKNEAHSDEEWAALREMNLFNFEMECKISHIKNYKYESPKFKHDFIVGNKLEAVDPQYQSSIVPATVVEVFDPYYFLVQIDGRDSQFLATLDHPYIFPVGWTESHGIGNWYQSSASSSSQTDSLRIVKTELFPFLNHAPDARVTPGMKLEVVYPLNRSQMCVATILSVNQDLLKVQPDIQGDETSFIFHLRDCQVFPLGWSRATGHPILPPVETCLAQVKSKETPVTSLLPCLPPLRCVGCEKMTIYLNHKCFTGPFLSKSKLAALPKQIGPGPVKLVLLDVIKRIANLAYVQMRILRELEAPHTKPPEGRTREELKVKYKKRVYKGIIEVALRLDAVPDYCTEVCRRLQVCPNLISLKPIPECPLNCSERNKAKSGKEKKNNKQPIDYKSFIFKPLTNPVSLVNRRPFQEDIPPPRDLSPQENIVWNKEKCLRKRKVNVFLEREKKRLKIQDDEETGSSKGKESEENSGEEEKRMRRGRLVVKQSLEQRKPEVNRDIIFIVEFCKKLKLPVRQEADPWTWTVDDVYQYVSQVPDLYSVASLLKAEETDGLAFMLLDFHLCRHTLKLDFATASLLCRLVEEVRYHSVKADKILWSYIRDNPTVIN